MEVLNQTPSLEEASDVKFDSHSTCQDDVKADSHSTKSGMVNDDAGVSEVAKEADEVVKSKPLSLKDENKQSEAAAAERGMAKESDEIVKSKPLLLREGDSQDRQPGSAAALGQISKETVQNSGTTLTGDNATPALKQEAEYADTKPASTTITSGVFTTHKDEPKIAGPDPENLLSAPTKPVVSTNRGHTAHSSSTGTVQGEACGTTSSQVGSSQTIESGQEGERNVAALSQVEKVEVAVQDAAAVEVLPSAPALIDFSNEAQQSNQQVVNVQTVTTTVASMSAEGTEDASQILYPRLDSIMQGILVEVT